MASPADAALLVAAESGDAPAAAAALDAGASLAATADTPRGRAPLAVAAAGGHAAVVRLLLARGADASARDEDADTAVKHAATGGHVDALDALLAAGASPSPADDDGWTPLHWAALCGHTDVLRALLAAGADAAAQNAVRALRHDDASACHARLTAYAIMRRAALHTQDGDTALQVASSDVARGALLSRGAGALLAAARCGDAGALAAALDGGADVDACDGSADSALHCAVWRGHGRCVALLLERGAAHSGGNAWGGTPLHLAAAQCGAAGALEALLARGADVGARDKVCACTASSSQQQRAPLCCSRRDARACAAARLTHTHRVCAPPAWRQSGARRRCTAPPTAATRAPWPRSSPAAPTLARRETCVRGMHVRSSHHAAARAPLTEMHAPCACVTHRARRMGARRWRLRPRPRRARRSRDTTTPRAQQRARRDAGAPQAAAS
jgi:ankyrin repeat protein